MSIIDPGGEKVKQLIDCAIDNLVKVREQLRPVLTHNIKESR